MRATPDDSPISVGDLVAVVRPMPCGCGDSIGWVYKVTKIAKQDHYTSGCRFCGKDYQVGLLAYREDGCGADLYRLKRIPPLGELEGQRTEEDIREPA